MDRIQQNQRRKVNRLENNSHPGTPSGDWAINYTIALQDTHWFKVTIPNATTWILDGNHYTSRSTITGTDLGFGKLYVCTDWKRAILSLTSPYIQKPHDYWDRTCQTGLPIRRLGWLTESSDCWRRCSFFSHEGFNEEGLTRALNELYKEVDNPIGNHPSQQVAKNLFTGNRVTLDRKVEEMIYTLGQEAALSKEAILALYLNSIEFGDGIYGITEACEQYFLKTPNFSRQRSVFLASILPNHELATDAQRGGR